MQTVNIHAAKTQLSRLIEAVEAGEEIIIARAGKPVARLVPIVAAVPLKRRLGTLDGQIDIPDDFDSMFADEIADLFEGR
ncbi:MAG: type II toxin-antitoxin system Phd/YefM family antitoxin [Pseudomonadota bacterium]|nr:type II toxin-antitoxin system Phd/YefM family antitoxin [Pseudomonadota bacterium]